MKSAGRHILILTPGFANDETDKTSIPMLQSLLAAYHNQYPEDRISIIAFQYPFTKKQYVWHGMDVYCMAGRNIIFPLRLLTWNRVVATFKKIHATIKIDIIHSFWLSECALLGQYLSKNYKMPHICTTMGQDCRPENRYLRFLNLSKIHVICLSQTMADLLKENTGKEAENLIPFGLAPRVQPIGQQRQIDILGVGSLVPVKNYGLFVEIVKALQPEFPQLQCMIIGNQPDEDELAAIRKKIAGAGLKSHITLRGQVDPEVVSDYMSRSKILLHTSRYEGQGLVFGEALASGMSVVSFNVGRTYTEKTYICGNEEQMIEALRRLLNDKDLSFEPVWHETMTDTVEAYHQLYHT